MKLQPNSFSSVQLTELTKICIQLCKKGNKLKNEHARVIALVYDMSSECALNIYLKFRCNTSNGYQVIEQT